jgi:hypothetical protein
MSKLHGKDPPALGADDVDEGAPQGLDGQAGNRLVISAIFAIGTPILVNIVTEMLLTIK